MAGKKQIMQEIIDWSKSENSSFPSACEAFYDILTSFDGTEDSGIHLPSGVCYHEDEVDDRDDFYIVFSFTDAKGEKKFYKISGFYSSWDGVSWEDAEMTRVYPEKITVTQYSSKKPA